MRLRKREDIVKKAWIIIIVILVAGGIVFAVVKNNDSSNKNSDTKTTTSSNSSKKSSAATGTDFTINANDETADIKTLNVKKGDTIHVTFKVDTDSVYHGGLEFKSDVVSSQPIKPGDSDTVTFTADKSFDFTPYWYQSDVKKDYLIAVKVQ